jgi:hypothetical protein
MSGLDEVTASLGAASLAAQYDDNELDDFFFVPGVSDSPRYVHVATARIYL